MKQFSTTRQELAARKNQLELAGQGCDLLEQKQSALLEELFRIADTVFSKSEALQEIAREAHLALVRAETISSSEAVRCAALAVRAELPLRVETTNIMGIEIPVIEQRRVVRSMGSRGYPMSGTSTAIDEAAAAFEIEIEAIIHLAESELRLIRLADELKRTTHRLNALRHILIPRLRTECAYIEQSLAERERSDHYRIKLAKKKHSIR